MQANLSVYYDGSAYICITATSDIEAAPDTNADWALMVRGTP